MKLEDFAYEIAQRVFQELEHTHHYTVPEDFKKDILDKVQKNLNDFIRK